MCIAVIALALAFSLFGFLIGGAGTLAENMVAPDPAKERYTVGSEITEMAPVITKTSNEPVRLRYTVKTGSAIIITAVTLGVSACSVLAASVKTLRMKPRDILSSMS